MTEQPRRRKTDNWNGRAAAAMEWVWRVATVLLVPMLLWISVTLIAIDKRVTVIEASQFTVSDGAAVWRAVEQRPTREEVPTRLREDVQELRDEMRALREALLEANR